MAQLQKLLWAAQRPLAILGGSGWNAAGCAAFQRFAARFDLPVATSFRRAMLFDADHRCFAGEIGIGPNPALQARIEEADLVLLVGGRMSEMPSQSYELFQIPSPRQQLVHVHAGAEELGRVYHPELAIHATASAFCASLESLQPPQAIAWSARTLQARSEFEAWTTPVAGDPDARFAMSSAMRWLRQRLPPDAILTNGAGNYAIWPGRYLRSRRFGTQLAPTSGSMGYGVPAAVAAKLQHRDRMVLCFAGDGCFLMNGQEFATAVQYGCAIIVVVVDNGMYGTIRMHQEREYPGRVSGTGLRNPDFAALARAFGGHGESVDTNAAFAPAFERALASGLPAILHVKTDPEAITPSATLAGLRAKARG